MIKATTSGGLVLFGLSFTNLDRLRKGEPIVFEGKEIGYPEIRSIMIFADKDEQTMLGKLIEAGYIPADAADPSNSH